MYESARSKTAKVVGPSGPVTIADLPPVGTQRWSIRRKAAVVAAVRGGLLSLEEVCRRYALNVEEYLSWEYCIDHYGPAGLRTTLTQFYLTNGGRQRSLRRYSTNRDRRTVRAVATLAHQESAKSFDIEGRRLFAVVARWSGFTQRRSSGFGRGSSDSASTDSLCMNGECRSDFNVAWLGTRTTMRVSGSVMAKWCDTQIPSGEGVPP
jgi:hypothetical protein